MLALESSSTLLDKGGWLGKHALVEALDAYTFRSTQPCIAPGSLNRVPASAGLRAGMLPLPGGR